MIFKAYARHDGAYILVPDCLVASREAQTRHGPLSYVGLVDSSTHLEPAVWDRVLSDVDRQSYAVVRSTMRPLLARATPRQVQPA